MNFNKFLFARDIYYEKKKIHDQKFSKLLFKKSLWNLVVECNDCLNSNIPKFLGSMFLKNICMS
jgi:hypothetical protein